MLAYTGPMKIFSGSANRKFAEDICKFLDMPLGETNIGRFSMEKFTSLLKRL